MAEIHSPDIYGDVKLATNPGTTGQVLTSAGAGVQAIWSTTNVTINDTATATAITTVTEAPANNFDIDVDVKVSADANNIIVIHANGIYASLPFNIFTFTSPSALTHTITHNLNNTFPSITVWDSGSGQVVIPDTIQALNSSQLSITFFVARAIAGTIAG